MENDNNQRMILSIPDENITSIVFISNFLKDNGIEESKEETYKKIKEGKNPLPVVIKRAVLDFAGKKISEADLSVFLRKEANISEEASGKLVKNIKKTFLPLVKKVTMEAQTQEEKTSLTAPPKATDGSRNIAEEMATKEPAIEKEEKFAERKRRTIKDIANPPEITKKETPNLPKGPDVYREPIE